MPFGGNFGDHLTAITSGACCAEVASYSYQVLYLNWSNSRQNQSTLYDQTEGGLIHLLGIPGAKIAGGGGIGLTHNYFSTECRVRQVHCSSFFTSAHTYAFLVQVQCL